MDSEPDKPLAVSVRNPHALIERAIDKGISGAELNGLLDFAERLERNAASKQFGEAITAFQRDCPQIEKTRNVEGKYNYSPFDEIMQVAGPIMVRHGIVATFSFGTTTEAGIEITCRIRVGTHQEITTLTMPIPAGNKLVNASQLMGQATSYGKRYALCAALNIVTTEEDKDAAGCLETLDENEIEELNQAMRLKGMPIEAFLRFAQAESLESIPRREFPRLLNAIKNTKAKARPQ